MSLFLASSRKASDLESKPSVPKTRSPTSLWNNCNGIWGILFTMWTIIWMLFNTFLDVVNYIATALFLKDTETPLKGSPEVLSRKRIGHRIVSLHDIKLVKSAMNATINDVLLGITMASISRNLSEKYAPRSFGYEKDQGNTSKKDNYLPTKIRLRSRLIYNLRPSTVIESLAAMMQMETRVKWGNKFASILLPLTLALQDDPLDYVRKAKAIADRKKVSLEGICSIFIGRFVIKLLGFKQYAAFTYKMTSNTTLTFSNVVGPREEISFYGHHLAYIAPSVYGQPQALTVHWQSYGEKMILVLTVDPDVIPDYENLSAEFEAVPGKAETMQKQD